MERIKIEGVYSESARLKEIIESHRWTLFDATLPEGKNRPFSWDELAKRGCAEQFEIGHNYFFVPKPKKNQTLREAYAVTKGIGPAIVLPSIEDHLDMDGEGSWTVNGKLTYPFSRLLFEDEFLVAMSPEQPQFADVKLPLLGIPYRRVIDKFSKYFTILKPEDLNIDPEKVKDIKCLPAPTSDPDSN